MSRKAQMPYDENQQVIPVLRFYDKAHHIPASAVSARNADAFSAGIQAVLVTPEENVYVKFGGPDVTASNTDHWLKAGVSYDLAIADANGKQTYTHMAVVAATGTTVVHISERF